mmetsp:Transcript_12060/g.29880  ORF Transcript_12060/g.29880 Transcript_12060/m.29880 type:complete len:490 (-) Transcript_12060:1188-2657(-)
MRELQPAYRSVPRKTSAAVSSMPYSTPYGRESRLGSTSRLSTRARRPCRSGSADRSSSFAATRTTSPARRYVAEFSAAAITPAGLQLNLYMSGLSAHSGAGRPPHTELKDVTVPPRACASAMMRSADMWSIPGSRPISQSSGTPAASAFSWSAAISSEMYEAVTSGVRPRTHAVAIAGCMPAGRSESTPSAEAIRSHTAAQSSRSAGAADLETAARLGLRRDLHSAAASPSSDETTVTIVERSRERNSTAGFAHIPAPITTTCRRACEAGRLLARERVRSYTPSQKSGSSWMLARASGLAATTSLTSERTSSSAPLPCSTVSCRRTVDGISGVTDVSMMAKWAEAASTTSSTALITPKSNRCPLIATTVDPCSSKGSEVGACFDWHDCRSFARLIAGMNWKDGVSCPLAVIVAAHSSAGSLPPADIACRSKGSVGSDDTSPSTNGSSASPKCSLASRGSSAGRMSTPITSTPSPSEPRAHSCRRSTSYM